MNKKTRVDAQKNRAKIIAAAKKAFSDNPNTSMNDIARIAHVGKGTIYRNFPDRSYLIAEIIQEDITYLAKIASADPNNPLIFQRLLTEIGKIISQSYVFFEIARSDLSKKSTLHQLQKQLIVILEKPLENAQQAGLILKTLSSVDILVIIKMLKGSVEFQMDYQERKHNITVALEIIFTGIKVK